MALAQPTRPVVLSFWGSDVFGRYEPVSQLCARFADEVIVVSEEMADSVNTEVTVIPHCIDFDLFEPVPQEAAQSEIGWDSDATHILFPYDPSREVKNYPRAERIVERARERLSDPVQLHAVSGVPHERIPFYMNAADVLLLTSRWEGSPNAVREALAVGLPVVATDVGDIRTRVAGVSPSAVGQTDESLVDELVTVIRRGERSNGREQHANLSLDWMGDRILEVYQRALGSEY